MKESSRKIGFLCWRVAFKKSCDHCKQAIWSNSAIEIGVESPNGQDVLEEDDDTLDFWHLGNPFLHQKCWLIAHTCNASHIDGDIHLYCSASRALGCVQIVKSHWVVDAEKIVPPLRLEKRNWWIYFKLDDWHLCIEISRARYDPAHSIDVNRNLRKEIACIFLQIARQPTKQNVNIGIG